MGKIKKREQLLPAATVKIDGVEHPIPLPAQFHEFGTWKQRQYVRRAARQVRRRVEWLKITRERAEKEKWTPPPLTSFVQAEDVDPDNPKYVIRVVYGPLCGLDRSQLLVLRHNERYLGRRIGGEMIRGADAFRGETLAALADPATGSMKAPEEADTDLVESRGDAYDRVNRTTGQRLVNTWGPKRLLWNVLDLVARHGGDCVIVFIHNGVRMRVDPEAFEAWVRRAEADPVEALVAPQTYLLEDHDDPAAT